MIEYYDYAPLSIFGEELGLRHSTLLLGSNTLSCFLDEMPAIPFAEGVVLNDIAHAISLWQKLSEKHISFKDVKTDFENLADVKKFLVIFGLNLTHTLGGHVRGITAWPVNADINSCPNNVLSISPDTLNILTFLARYFPPVSHKIELDSGGFDPAGIEVQIAPGKVQSLVYINH